MAASRLVRNTILGLLASVALAAAKLLAGILGHSSALIADAVESLADTIGSLVVWQGLRVADRPADPDHPYGYGKAEALAALAVGVLLLAAAALIVVRAAQAMLTPHQAPAAWTLLVLVGVIAIKEFLFRVVIRGAEELGSDAARADAWHHRSDAITSLAACIGIAVAVWGPRLGGSPRLVLADEAAAMLASGVIAITAWRLIRPALDELLDAVAHDLARDVAHTAASVHGVRLVEKVHARKSGRGYLVDMHLHVDPQLPIRDAHALGGKVKAVILDRHPRVRHVLTHVEPDERPTA